MHKSWESYLISFRTLYFQLDLLAISWMCLVYEYGEWWSHLCAKFKIMHTSWGELSCILLKTISLQFILDLSIWYLNSYLVCLWKTKLLFFVLCAIIKSVEGLVYLLEPWSLLGVCYFWYQLQWDISFIDIFFN